MSHSAVEWACNVSKVVMSSPTPAIACTICCNWIQFSSTDFSKRHMIRIPNRQQSHSLAQYVTWKENSNLLVVL